MSVGIGRAAQAAGDQLNSIVVGGKNVSERPKESPLLRPIRDGEDHLGERPCKLVLQSPTEIGRCAMWVIVKSTATPRPENDGRMSERFCDRQNAMNATLQ